MKYPQCQNENPEMLKHDKATVMGMKGPPSPPEVSKNYIDLENKVIR